MNFIITAGLIFSLYYLAKPFYLSNKKYEDFFTNKWEKYVFEGDTFEKKLKKFKRLQKVMFIVCLFVFVIYVYFTMVISFR